MKNLQLVLAGGKGVSTDLTIFLSNSESDLLVYLGVALLERVDYNPNQFAYKMLIGRLVNAGVALMELNRQFKHDGRTMKKWAEGLKSDDPDFIVRAFAGRGPFAKVIGPMIRLVKMRYLALKGVVRNYRQVIAREVEECFGEKISRETLRHLFKLAREEQERAMRDESAADGPVAVGGDLVPSQENGLPERIPSDRVETEATTCLLPEISASNESLTDNHSTSFSPPASPDTPAALEMDSTEETAVVRDGSGNSDQRLEMDLGSDPSTGDTNCGACSPPPSVPTTTTLPYSGMQPTGQLRALQHVGQILFSPWLDMVGFERVHSRGLQSQWIGQILQGAVNIEQSHLICDTSLALFTGPVVSGLKAQRLHLKKMADAEAVLDVYKANSRLLPDGPGVGTAFYYDPHSKECSTLLEMLKGWCGRLHSTAKVLHLDCIHTQSGLPCFIQHYDNFYDLRERFFITLSLFENLFPKKSLSGSIFILDRGIFAQNVFSKFREHHCHLITWEKGYKKDGWEVGRSALIFHLFRERNQPDDLKEYSFECQESPWHKDTSIRRIIVRATSPKETTIELSVLCTHLTMNVKEVIRLIFNRWIQENNFKYLDLYFGLMQITSYASENYRDIAHTLIDRWVDSPEYRQLKHQFSAEEQALGKLLLKRERQTTLQETTRNQHSLICQTVTDGEYQLQELRQQLKVPQKSRKFQQLKQRLKELRKKRSTLKLKMTSYRVKMWLRDNSSTHQFNFDSGCLA